MWGIIIIVITIVFVFLTNYDYSHLRTDYSFRQALSPIARKACDIVSRIRDDEKRAGNLTVSQATTRSWQIIRRLPKGALFHGDCHSLVDIEHLLEAALGTPGMCIACDDGGMSSTDARRERGLSIQFRDKADSEGSSIWTDDYKPGTFIALAKAADDYPEGGKRGFLEWLKERYRISQQDSSLLEASAASFGCSEIINRMLYYEPLWRMFLRRLMASLVGDAISWLELR